MQKELKLKLNYCSVFKIQKESLRKQELNLNQAEVLITSQSQIATKESNKSKGALPSSLR